MKERDRESQIACFLLVFSQAKTKPITSFSPSRPLSLFATSFSSFKRFKSCLLPFLSFLIQENVWRKEGMKKDTKESVNWVTFSSLISSNLLLDSIKILEQIMKSQQEISWLYNYIFFKSSLFILRWTNDSFLSLFHLTSLSSNLNFFATSSVQWHWTWHRLSSSLNILFLTLTKNELFLQNQITVSFPGTNVTIGWKLITWSNYLLL